LPRVLIAEDDHLISDFIVKGLEASGFTTFVVDDGPGAERLALGGDFDLMILDLGLPERDGFHVLEAIRARGKDTPVLVLTGRSERDVVSCLEAGADDYMVKPFRFEELLARIRTRLRAKGTPEQHVLVVGDVRLDIRSRRVTVDESTVDLTTREYELLETFMRHPDQVLSRQQLLSQVWGFYFDTSSNIVNVYVSQLRNKLGDDVVETVRGAGYRMSRKVSPSSRA
jgi:DNA-binding response OmpR family regulator